MPAETPTLREYLNGQPRDQYNDLVAKLSIAVSRSLHSIDKYLSGAVIPPAEVQTSINKHLSKLASKKAGFDVEITIDFERANREYLKKDNHTLKTKLKATA